MFSKVLVANRGEIAVRIIRSLKELGIKSVAIYSTADRESLHVQLADEAVCVGTARPQDSYLNMQNILAAAVGTGAEAIHPGFGFLSENSRFVEMCEACGLTFIGPKSQTIELMGNKANARMQMQASNVPVIPGSDGFISDVVEAKAVAKKVGYPVLLKAAAGGGGKGMRVAHEPSEFKRLFNMAQLESVNSFSSDAMYLERYIVNPKHVEIQIIADTHGNVVALGERDCSTQRNHQKLIEEAPSPAIDDTIRQAMNEAAVLAATTVGYVNAGTVEFILDNEGNFYFMEMNTRIQVEHGVTEMVTGTDLIIEQIRVANGEKLSFKQEEVQLRGHAIECRINAEIPEKNFMPNPGKVTHLHLPAGNGVRVDTALYSGYVIPPDYDSMIAKILVHAPTREAAIMKMRAALDETVILGVETNLDFQYQLLRHPLFVEGNVDTGFVNRMLHLD